MAPATTNVWPTAESSLSRSSFNAMVTNNPVDVPEIMMRSNVMGRQAIMGPGWSPSSITARKLADVAMQGSTMKSPVWQSLGERNSKLTGTAMGVPISMGTNRRQRPTSNVPTIPGGYDFFQDPATATPAVGRRSLNDFLRSEFPSAGAADVPNREPSTPAVSRFKPMSMDPPKMAWGSMMVPKKVMLERRQASAPALSSSGRAAAPSSSKLASSEATPRIEMQGFNSSSATILMPDGVQRPGSAPDGTALSAPRQRLPRDHQFLRFSQVSSRQV